MRTYNLPYSAMLDFLVKRSRSASFFFCKRAEEQRLSFYEQNDNLS